MGLCFFVYRAVQDGNLLIYGAVYLLFVIGLFLFMYRAVQDGNLLPCGGRSFLVSTRKEPKKRTGEALNMILSRPWQFRDPVARIRTVLPGSPPGKATPSSFPCVL